MSIQEAIVLNNQVVSFLENKLFDEAILSSCAALAMFQQYQHMADNVVSELGNDSIDQFMLDNDHKRSFDDTMMEFIYEDGIVLPTNNKDHRVITPVLIFNCALSHQLSARHCNDGGTCHKYLVRAKQLYQLAIQQDQEVKNVMFMLAMINNNGVILKWLGNYEESKQRFGNLVSLMMVYVDIGVESKFRRPIQGFWRNVLGKGSMAPAA